MNLIWCPSIDSEMRGQMETVISTFPHMHKTPLEGGKKELGSFTPLTDKLYIIAHGHAQMPLFTCNKKHWNATELVDLLQTDGLPTTWRDIELLVCHAGESVNSVKVGSKLLALQQMGKDLKAQGVAPGSSQFTKLGKKFDAIAAKGPKPSAFTSDDQLLPLVAQFTQALKNKKYTNFRVISYAAPVAQNFSTGEVRLDLRKTGGEWGEPLSKYPHLKKVWH
jgi:hypothetical protein